MRLLRRSCGQGLLLPVAIALASPAAVAAQPQGNGADPAPTGEACEAGALGGLDELDVRPPDGAEGVARNAPVLVQYGNAADLDALERLLEDDTSAACDGLICLFRDDSDQGGHERVPVPGQVQRLNGAALAFVPDARLARERRYFALVPRAGFERLTRSEVTFETGDSDDNEPPELHVDGELRVELSLLPPECDVAPGTLRVGVRVPEVQDDGDRESVEVLLFLTRAPGLAGPELRARAPNLGGAALSFLLSPQQASDTVCVGVRAIDGVGRVAEYDEEVCFFPHDGGFFEAGCSAGARPSRGGKSSGTSGAPLLLPLAAMALVFRRLRRSR